MDDPNGPYKRARVSLTLRLICGYLSRSFLPFLTCIYYTLLDLEIYQITVSSGIGFFKKVYQSMPSILSRSTLYSHPRPKHVFTNGLRVLNLVCFITLPPRVSKALENPSGNRWYVESSQGTLQRLSCFQRPPGYGPPFPLGTIRG